MAAERGQASSLVNAGFRAPRVEEKEKTRVKGGGARPRRQAAEANREEEDE